MNDKINPIEQDKERLPLNPEMPFAHLLSSPGTCLEPTSLSITQLAGSIGEANPTLPLVNGQPTEPRDLSDS